jgi:hypothetical protein
MALVPASHLITAAPGFQVLRDVGLVTWVAVAVWAGAAARLWGRTRAPREATPATVGLPDANAV